MLSAGPCLCDADRAGSGSRTTRDPIAMARVTNARTHHEQKVLSVGAVACVTDLERRERSNLAPPEHTRREDRQVP